MASFSGKKRDNENKRLEQNMLAATQPKPYEDPFGSFKSGKFEPKESSQDIQARGLIDQKMLGMLEDMPEDFTVESFYDNPFYENTRSMYRRAIDRDRDRDQKQLTDNLNARNQMGSSYDALMQRYMNQDYNDRYDQADDAARGASANAYQQAFQNAMNTFQALGGEESRARELYYAPAKMALGYQSAVAPLQGAQANFYGNAMGYNMQRPTVGDRMWGLGSQALGGVFDVLSSAVRRPIGTP